MKHCQKFGPRGRASKMAANEKIVSVVDDDLNTTECLLCRIV